MADPYAAQDVARLIDTAQIYGNHEDIAEAATAKSCTVSKHVETVSL